MPMKVMVGLLYMVTGLVGLTGPSISHSPACTECPFHGGTLLFSWALSSSF